MDAAKPGLYALDGFLYPSGAGLHISDAFRERLGDKASGEPVGPLPLDSRRAPVEAYRLA